tara:strand:+ start:2103 stop:2771 length:669 start_codon:yes stop_codon:yes gene_type:complete
MLTIEAKKRDILGKKVRSLRDEGSLPAVLYGPKEETTSITVPAKAFGSVWKEAGETTVVSLKVDGSDKDVMIHSVDVDPVKGAPIHVDFYAIDKDKKVTVQVPLEFTGVAPAVKGLGGTLVKVLHELEIEALPKNLPHELEVDISGLADFEAHIAIKDIKLPEGVEALGDADETVALVSAPREEEEEEEAAPADFSQVEVEKKGKQEEEGEESGDSSGEKSE